VTRAFRFAVLGSLLLLLFLGQGAAEADGPFTPTFSITASETAPDDPDILPADHECAVGTVCKILNSVELPDAQSGWGGYGVLPSSIVGLAGDTLVPDGAIVGKALGSVRVGPLGHCASEGTLASFEAVWLDGTTDAATTTGSPSDLCSYSHWPAQLNGPRDDFLSAFPGAILTARRVGCSPSITENVLLFTHTDGSILYTTVVADPTEPPTLEWCGPASLRSVALGLTLDNHATTAQEGGIPLLTCTAQGMQTFKEFFDRLDTPEWDPVVPQDTITCSPNTPAGSDVSVPLNGGTDALAGIDLTFSNVTGGGTTSVVTTTAGPPPPTGFKIVGLAELPLYFDINTDASYSGELSICVKYDETEVQGPESALRLMQGVDDNYVDVTTSVDTVGDTICGTTTHLSIFVVAEPLAAVGGVVELRSDGPAPPTHKTNSAFPLNIVLAGATALALVVVAAGAWYAGRRRVR
jgi:hypothetical protein